MTTRWRFLNDERGNVAAIFALALLPLMGGAGAAIDYSRLSAERARLQAVADRAALAAAMAPDVTDAQRISVASSFFNRPAGQNGTTVIDGNGRGLAVSVDGNAVTVETSAPVKMAVMGLMGVDTARAGVRSKAVQITRGQPVCVLALHPNVRDAISFSGNTSFIADGCAIHANSTSGSAIEANGSAEAKAWSFCAVGGVNRSKLTATSTDANAIRSGCFRQKDPFKDLPAPAVGLCHEDKRNVAVKPSDTVTLDPGTYCGGLDLKGTVTLRPGMYVVKGGSLHVNSQAQITGEGVTFYFTDTGAGFDVNGGGSVTLSAPTQGTYRNMLIMQDPASNAGATNKINGNSTLTLKGAIYTPTQNIEMSGNSGFGTSGTFMPLVASTLKFTGSSTVRAQVAAHPTQKPLPLSEIGARLED